MEKNQVLCDSKMLRYSRQIMLPSFDLEGQEHTQVLDGLTGKVTR